MDIYVYTQTHRHTHKHTHTHLYTSNDILDIGENNIAGNETTFKDGQSSSLLRAKQTHVKPEENSVYPMGQSSHIQPQLSIYMKQQLALTLIKISVKWSLVSHNFLTHCAEIKTHFPKRVNQGAH